MSQKDGSVSGPIPIFKHVIFVRREDIDENHHANNVSYVRWMQEAAIAHATANGWPGSKCNELGVAWVARRHTVEYLIPALEGEKIIIRTWIGDWKKLTSRRYYRFLRETDGKIIANAETNWVMVNTATGRATKIPDPITESFVIVPEQIKFG